MFTWIVSTLLFVLDARTDAEQQRSAADLRSCLLQRAAGKSKHPSCLQSARRLRLYEVSVEHSEVAIKNYLRAGADIVYWVGEKVISDKAFAHLIGCSQMTWAVRVARGNMTEANEMLNWDWQTAEFSQFPMFLVLAATARTCQRKQRCKVDSRGALKIRSELLRLHTQLREELWKDWSEDWWKEEDEWLQKFANSEMLASFRRSMDAVRLWVSSTPDWVRAGQEANLWRVLQSIYDEIADGPPCTGYFVRTNHLEELSHGLCFSESAPGSVRVAVTGKGFWADGDAIAHIFLLVAEQLHLSPENCRIVDIGANVGALSLLLAQLSFPVVAIEADPVNLNGLIQSIARLRLDDMGVPSSKSRSCSAAPGKLQVHWVAASDRVGSLQLNTARGDGSTSAVQWKQVPGNPGDWAKRSTIVPTAPLDEILADAQKVMPARMVKLDIEGSEWRALLGMQDILRTTEVVAIEVWPRMLLRSGCRSPAMLARALPGFEFHYSFTPHLHEAAKRVDLCPLEKRCFELRFWAGWVSCINPQNVSREETANLILTREAIHDLPRVQTFGDAVTITNAFC